MVRIKDTVARFSATELVLEDGTRLVLYADTVIDGTLEAGVEVEVEVLKSDDTLTARKIKVK